MYAICVTSLLILVTLASGSERAKRQSLVETACKREPTLPYCPTTVAAATQTTTTEAQAATTTQQATTTTTQPEATTTTTTKTTTASTTVQADETKTKRTPPTPPSTLPPIRAAIEAAGGKENIDFAAYCAAYEDRYHYYCPDIISQPVELQAKLYRYCPLYRKYCNPLHSSPKPEFPTIPTTVVTTLQPCTRDCKAPHCTPNCICIYTGKEIKDQCMGDGEGGSGAFAFLQNTCEMWWKSCEPHLTEKQRERVKFLMADKYKSKERQDGAGQTDIMTKHNEKPQVQFWQQPNSQHTDWMNGDIRQGADWGVPAFGISGNAGESNVKFPSIGSFMGRKRRKRSYQERAVEWMFFNTNHELQ